MRIADLAKIDRPREKLIKYGPGKLSNSELLAILIGSGKKGLNVIDLSKNILRNLSSTLPNASYNDLRNISGLGPAKACEIIACFELGKRLLKDKISQLIIDPKDVWNELKNIRESKKEHFVIFYLDSKNQTIQKEVISIGILNANLVHPREVFEPAVRNLAAQIIIAHNHPSGNLNPSEEDILVTNKLVDAGKVLGIGILDHIIVSKNGFYSFSEQGMLSV